MITLQQIENSEAVFAAAAAAGAADAQAGLPCDPPCNYTRYQAGAYRVGYNEARKRMDPVPESEESLREELQRLRDTLTTTGLILNGNRLPKIPILALAGQVANELKALRQTASSVALLQRRRLERCAMLRRRTAEVEEEDNHMIGLGEAIGMLDLAAPAHEQYPGPAPVCSNCGRISGICICPTGEACA